MKKLISKHQQGNTLRKSIEDKLTYGLGKVGSALGAVGSFMEEPQKLMMEAFTGKKQLPSQALGFKNIPRVNTSGAYIPYSANPITNPKGNSVQVPKTFNDLGNLGKHAANTLIDGAADPLNALGGIGALAKYGKGIAKSHNILLDNRISKSMDNIARYKTEADAIEKELKLHSITPNERVYNHVLNKGLKQEEVKGYSMRLNPSQNIELNAERIRATQGGGPKILKNEDFYNLDELNNLTDQYAQFQEAQNTFDKMHPISGQEMMMRAMTGDRSRDELFRNLYPNITKPEFNEKILHPEHAAELKPILTRNEAINPSQLRPNTLKRLNLNYDRPHHIVNSMKGHKDPFWQNHKDIVGEFRGLLNINYEDLNKFSPDQLKTFAEQIKSKLMKDDWNLFNNETPFTGKEAFQNTSLNKKGGLIKRKSK